MRALLVAVVVMLFLFPAALAAEPRNSYITRIGGVNYVFTQTESFKEPYFFRLPGNAWRFKAQGQAPPDDVLTRNTLIRVLSDAFFNRRVVDADLGRLVQLKKGLCVPAKFLDSGLPSPIAYAVDLKVEKDRVVGFVVGSSLACTMAERFQ